MADTVAEEIIALQKSEEASDANFRTLWQDSADLILPRKNRIIRTTTPGEDKFRDIYNTVPIQSAKDMASGLSGTLIPAGQEFFSIMPKNKKLMRNENVSRWMSYATERAHERMFESNFILVLNENLIQNLVFGTSCIYSEWNLNGLGLNFRNIDIGTYHILENYAGIVDTVIFKFPLTARQAIQAFGNACPPKILNEREKSKGGEKSYEFINCVRPRKERIIGRNDQKNKPIESIYIFVEDCVVIAEEGFDEMPYNVARWSKSSAEKWGRGQGTDALPAVRQLQQMERDLTECGNKHNNPPLEVLESFEGRVRVVPGAENRVSQMNSIQPIRGAQGNFPYTREMIERKEEEIRRAFFLDIFAQFSQMTGDRRTTTEIRERKNEGMRRLGMPVLRYQSELLNPLITRCVLLLLRNGDIELPPRELQGQSFGLEFKGELALALRDQQARGFLQFAEFVSGVAEFFPAAIDSLAMERALPRMARAFGVNPEDLSTEEERGAKQQKRDEEAQQIKQMQAAQVASRSLKDASDKPEAGSPAEAVLAEMGA